jgi:PAS domain S-box-containing protein
MRLLEDRGLCVFVLDHNCRISKWGTGATELLGFTPEDVLGKRLSDSGVMKESEMQLGQFAERLAKPGSFSLRRIFVGIDGTEFPAELMVHPIADAGGNIQSILMLVYEVNGKIEKEERVDLNDIESHAGQSEKLEAARFRSLVENDQDMMLLMDKDFQMIYHSPSIITTTGYTSDEWVKLDFIRDFIHPEDRDNFQQSFKTSVSAPGEFVQVRYRGLHKSGQYFDIEGTIINLINEENVQAYILNTKDVSEKIKREARLSEKRQLLLERDQLLDIFVKYSPAAIAMLDMDLKYLFVSQRWLNDYKLEGMNIIGKSHYEVFPEIGDDWKAVHQRALKGEILFSEEDKFVRSDGEETWLRWQVRPWSYGDEKMGGIIMFTEDITKRKKSEEAIRLSEHRYRQLVERISDGFMALDTNDRFVYMNNSAERLLGQTAEKLLGQNIWQIFPTALEKEFYQRYRQAQYSLQDTMVQIYSSAVDGWVECRIYPSATGCSIFLKNIDKQRRAELALRREVRSRMLIMDSALDAIISINRTGHIIFWNPQAERIFGWTEEEAMNQKLSEMIIPARYRRRHEEGMMNYKRSGKGPILNTLMEMSAVNREGTEFPVELFIIPVEDRDEVFFCSFIRDISERKKTEIALLESRKRLEQAQKIAHVGSWFVDLKSGKIEWSEELKSIYELDPSKDFLDNSEWTKLVHPDDRERVIRTLEQTTQTDISMSFRLQFPDGRLKYIYAEGTYERDSDGQALFVYGINHDITSQKKLELELLEQQKQEQLKMAGVALQAQERERNLIGQELHDNVNQILVGTNLLLSILAKKEGIDQSLVATCKKNVEEAIAENRRIAHELSSPVFSDINLPEKISQLCNTMLAPAEIMYELDMDSYDGSKLTEPQKVEVYRIVQEQLQNIVKHSRAIHVFLRLMHSENRCLLTITDDGMGTASPYSGNGIGMRNMQARAASLKGSLTITTAPGKGFALILTIPVAVQ